MFEDVETLGTYLEEYQSGTADIAGFKNDSVRSCTLRSGVSCAEFLVNGIFAVQIIVKVYALFRR